MHLRVYARNRACQNERRIAQIRIKPNTADPIPTARRMLSGVASAAFMARRIQAGLAANSSPSSTNRMPTPMRKSANPMDLIELEPPPAAFFLLEPFSVLIESEPSGADLTFAAHPPHLPSCERQIQSSTSIN